jgi:hypothetical protein
MLPRELFRQSKAAWGESLAFVVVTVVVIVGCNRYSCWWCRCWGWGSSNAL